MKPIGAINIYAIYPEPNPCNSLNRHLSMFYPANNNFWLKSPLRIRACQQTAGLTFTCSQSDLNYHPASLGVTCGQHFESPAVFSFLTGIAATNH